MFWSFGPEACGILAPWPGIKPAPPALEGQVPSTGLLGKSHHICGLCLFVVFFHVLCLFLVWPNCIWDLSSPEIKWKWSRSVMSNSLRPHGLYLPGSSIHGIFQARLLEWVAIPFSRGSSQPRDWTWVSCIAGRLLTVWATEGLQGSNPHRLHWKHEVLTTYQENSCFLGGWGGVWPHHVACGLSVPQAGIESMPLAVDG